MLPGRKPLDPETKREHRRLSSALYEAKQKRRPAARCESIAKSDYHTKRKYRARAAEHSERYRDRKLEEERVERRSAGVVKRRERKLEAENLRASHMQSSKPQLPHGLRQPHETLPVASSSRSSSKQVIPGPISSHKKSGHLSNTDEEDSDSSVVTEAICPRVLDKPVFPACITPRTAVGTMCKGCGLYDCLGCPCMCKDSPLWIDHPGGHFFPDCKKCGGTDCPGLVHEHWKGAVTSKKTLAGMLDAYPDIQTFNAPTWSRFQDLWNQDWAEYHYHPDMPVIMPVPALKLPSPGPPGSLPTEDAHKREAAFKRNLLHKFALFKPPPVLMSKQHTSALFTRVLGVDMSVDDIAKRMAEASLHHRAQPVEDINSLRARLAAQMKEEMAPEYMVKKFPATFNSHAHTKPCLTGWPEALPYDREGVEDSWARNARLRDYLDSLPVIRCNFWVLNVFEFEPQEHSCEDYSMHTGEFFAVVHEEWKGAVTSEKTLECMLYIYPGAHTFKASTWSDFLAKWNAHCTETHHHSGELLVTPESQLPSTRGPGLLPTKEARLKEEVFVAEVKDRMCADFAI
ncbi:hypothetical protein K438DRAFT_1772451 [Mycena galopus ATCC 62051]|nr:hypothetical protein K438DRAFT_1772451 [Mycena galopus ATCC 62051]